MNYIHSLFIALLLTGNLLAKDSKPLSEDSHEGEDVTCEVTDTKGKTTKVKGLRLFIDQGKSKYYYREFALSVGDAIIKIEFESIAALINKSGSSTVEIYLKNGKKITGDVFIRGDKEYLTGKAVYGKLAFKYKIDLNNISSVIQVNPPIPKIRQQIKALAK